MICLSYHTDRQTNERIHASSLQASSKHMRTTRHAAQTNKQTCDDSELLRDSCNKITLSSAIIITTLAGNKVRLDNSTRPIASSETNKDQTRQLQS